MLSYRELTESLEGNCSVEETIQDRITLLLESEQISPITAQTTARLLEKVEIRFGRPLLDAAAIMFTTHIAIALERLLRGETLTEGLPQDLLEEVQARSEDWRFAQTLTEFVQAETGAALPESEIGYMAAHLGALSLRYEERAH